MIALNLPLEGIFNTSGRSSPSPSIVSSASQSSLAAGCPRAELTPQFRSYHFLIGLLLAELSTVLECANPVLHRNVVNTLRGLMSSHDCDSRFSDPTARARVAALYMPMLGIVLRALPLLHRSGTDSCIKSEPADPIQSKVQFF